MTAVIGRLALSVCALVVILAIGSAERASADPSHVHLVIQDLEASRRIVGSEGTVIVRGIVTNLGLSRVHNVVISPAVAGSDGPAKNWRAVEVRPAGPISRLEPGDKIDAEAEIWLQGAGIYKVGLHAAADEGYSFPVGIPIRVVSPGASASDLASLAGMFTVAMLGFFGIGLYAMRPSTSQALWQPSFKQLGIGLGLMFGVTPLAWWGFQFLKWHIGGLPETAYWAIYYMPFYVVGAFFGGWVLASSGLRPRGSQIKGLVFGIGAYFLPAFVFAASWLTARQDGIVSLFDNWTDVVWLTALWPYFLAFNLGWFGLGPN